MGRLLVLCALFPASKASIYKTPLVLLESQANELDAYGNGNPVNRVVKLLREMASTLKDEMDEDQELYDKLTCWCNTGRSEKGAAVSEAESKAAELGSNIKAVSASVAALDSNLQQLTSDMATSKEGLANAQKMRDKEASNFQGNEDGTLANVRALKDAITVLEKNRGLALPQLVWPHEAMFLQMGHGTPAMDGTTANGEADMDEFMYRSYGMRPSELGHAQTFLASAQHLVKQRPSWSSCDAALVQRALTVAGAFMQATGKTDSMQVLAYAPQSDEILGIMKQLTLEMETELAAEQQAEKEALSSFTALRSSKIAEMDAMERQKEQKEDQLADDTMALAEAHKDLKQLEENLNENKKFLAGLGKQCGSADTDFEKRKQARLEEMRAVAETIEILTGDEARDAMSGTFSLLQVSSSDVGTRSGSMRTTVSALLRRVASQASDPKLSMLASRVELDSFSLVKQAIDEMIKALKDDQADEVSKHDWCNGELHANDMEMTKAQTQRDKLVAEVGELEMKVTALREELEQASGSIQQLHMELQRAGENRQAESIDFQRTVADQRATQVILKKALQKLSIVYNQAGFTQTSRASSSMQQQSAGAGGVMSMLAKLVQDAKELEQNAVASEAQAQAQYEEVVADTNSSVEALSKEIITKTAELAQATRDHNDKQVDVSDTLGELENLHATAEGLHADCNFLVHNFNLRQAARGQEIEALIQAKQTLDGAMLN